MYRFLVCLLLPISLLAKPSGSADLFRQQRNRSALSRIQCPGKLLKMSTVEGEVSSVEVCTKPGQSVEFYRVVDEGGRVREELSPVVCGVDQARLADDAIVERVKDQPVKVSYTTDGQHSFVYIGENTAPVITDAPSHNNESRCFIPTQFCEDGQLMMMPTLRGEEYVIQLCATPGVEEEEYFVEIAEPGLDEPNPRTRVEHVRCAENSVTWHKGNEVVQYTRHAWEPIVIRTIFDGERGLIYDHDEVRGPFELSADHPFFCYTRRV